MAVDYVRRVAPEPVLIVSYRNRFVMKGIRERTITEAIKARLQPEENDRVSHLTRGNHTATNRFTTHRHVVLMGLNFVPGPAAYAASGAIQDLSMLTAEEQPTNDDVQEIRVGSLRDSTLQAILRGNARLCQNGDCGPMTAVIPQVLQSGISYGDYRRMFPEADPQEDLTLIPLKPLKGNRRKITQFLEARAAAGHRVVSGSAICESLGVDRRDLSDLIRHALFKAWLAANGWRQINLKGNAKGFQFVG